MVENRPPEHLQTRCSVVHHGQPSRDYMHSASPRVDFLCTVSSAYDHTAGSATSQSANRPLAWTRLAAQRVTNSLEWRSESPHSLPSLCSLRAYAESVPPTSFAAYGYTG